MSNSEIPVQILGINDAGNEESYTANESKCQIHENGAVDASQIGQSNCQPGVAKRKVGRPRKCDSETEPKYSKSQHDDKSTENISDGCDNPKRGRGRPKKIKSDGKVSKSFFRDSIHFNNFIVHLRR